MHIEICPICDGEGKLCNGYDSVPLQETRFTSAVMLVPTTKPCHGCGKFPHGSGWIVVPDVIVALKEGGAKVQ